MARRMQISTKRLLIDKANSTIVVIVGVAAFITAFSLVAARSLLAKRSYQARVISVQEKARDQLQQNVAAVDALKTSYQEFVARPENIIGGSSGGTGERDGDNAKIVLDALPSKYDFPALAASIEKILTDRNYNIKAIGGTDDEVNQSGGESDGTGSATTDSTTGAVEMPFEVTAEGRYVSMIDLLKVAQNSIRPLYIEKLTISIGNSNVVQMNIQGKSYYQPEKGLTIKNEVVK